MSNAIPWRTGAADRPRYLRPAVVASLLAVVSLAHYVTPPAFILLHNVFQRLYYIPLLLACAWFGLRGALVTAAVCVVLYTPHILLHWTHMRAYQANQALELALLFLVGLVGGVLSDRERAQRRQAEAVAAERDHALRELQETVESLRQADRLATLGTLAAGMAHEIRNPLGAMGGAVDILERDYAPDHPHREFVDILRQEIGRLGGVVGRYLDFARPPALELVPVNVDATVASAIDLIRKSAERTGVRVVTRLGAGDARALADPVQVHQALVNLLLNGVQAMSGGGDLEVSTESVPDRVVVTVRDHGPGVPEGAAERIFEPFYSTRSDGTGLGLSVSRQIARTHGGRLTAGNAPGGGARFRLELPSSAERGSS